MSATASPVPTPTSWDGVIGEIVLPDESTEPPLLEGGETCALTSVVSSQYPGYCRKTRSCSSCLQKTGCMINQYGACVDQLNGQFSTLTNYSMAYSLGLVLPNASSDNPRSANSSQYWNFRSFEATYCAASDPVCQECIQRNFWSQSARPDSRFCEGKNGCVCIWDCEARWYMPDVQCTSATSSPSVVYEHVSKGLDSVVKFMILGLGVILLLFAACLFRCIRKDYDTRQRRELHVRQVREARNALRQQERQRRLGELGVSALSLSGWQRFRQTLIDKEKLRLNGRATGSDSTATDPVMPPTPETAYVLSIDEGETSPQVTNSVRPASEPPRASPTATASADASRIFVQ